MRETTEGLILTARLWYVADGPKAASFLEGCWALASAVSAVKTLPCTGLIPCYTASPLKRNTAYIALQHDHQDIQNRCVSMLP